jgi:hypothetical protein
MKKMFAKLGMPSLLSVAFLLGGLFFGATSAQAQTTTAGAPTPLIKTTGTWKSVPAAIATLNVQIAQIGQVLANSTPSNGTQLKVTMTIYKEIVIDLEQGIDTEKAAFTNYHEFAPGTGPVAHEAYPLSNGDWSNIFNEMVSQLTQ